MLTICTLAANLSLDNQINFNGYFLDKYMVVLMKYLAYKKSIFYNQ